MCPESTLREVASQLGCDHKDLASAVVGAAIARRLIVVEFLDAADAVSRLAEAKPELGAFLRFLAPALVDLLGASRIRELAFRARATRPVARIEDHSERLARFYVRRAQCWFPNIRAPWSMVVPLTQGSEEQPSGWIEKQVQAALERELGVRPGTDLASGLESELETRPFFVALVQDVEPSLATALAARFPGVTLVFVAAPGRAPRPGSEAMKLAPELKLDEIDRFWRKAIRLLPDPAKAYAE